MNVIKRDGSEVVFDSSKIYRAILGTNNDLDDSHKLSEATAKSIADDVVAKCESFNRAMNVEEIQDLVETGISRLGSFEAAKQYTLYRYKRALARQKNTTDDKILTLVDGVNEEVKQENSNKNPTVVSVQRDYVAGEVSRDIARRQLLPTDVMDAHDKGIIHFHDSDYYIQRMFNCCLINLEDMLQNGTVISGTAIEKPKSFLTACTIATQIVAQVASCQYGGQTISLAHLAPFVDISRQKIRRQLEEELNGAYMPYDQMERIVQMRLEREIRSGVQTIQYQVETLMTTNGQAPFISVFMYLNEVKDQVTKDDLALIIEEVLKQRIQGVKNEVGVYVTPSFPKLIFVLEEDNINPGSKYYYLTELAAKCTAKRMVPDYISEKIMLRDKVDKWGIGHCYSCMGCRSFLTVPRDERYRDKFYGRMNQGVVTINLPYVALMADKDLDKFWKLFDRYLEVCHKGLRCRHDRLLGTLSDASPIHWQYGAIARLKKGEKIDKLLYDGYSTISLGYAGLWECVRALIDKKLTDPEGKELGLKIMQTMNDYTAKWKAAENIDYSLYGTPIESTVYKFAKAIQRDFPIVKDVNDKNYISNSYHIKITEKVDAFTKLAFESEFQKLSPGGAISYVEVPNMQNNIPAVLSIMQFIYDHIMYAELNTKSDYCQVCGYDGEIQIVTDDNGKLVWECPNCKNRDQSKMNVARRTCG